MVNLMRALAVMLVLQIGVLCYALYIITNISTSTNISTVDCASLIDSQGEE